MKAHEYWFSHYGVRRNPGIFFMSFCTSKNNFKKLLKSCPILSLPILHYSKILSSILILVYQIHYNLSEKVSKFMRLL